MKTKDLNALKKALAEALAELKQAGDTSARGVERQWVLLVGVKVQAAADMAEGVEPVEAEPADVKQVVG